MKRGPSLWPREHGAYAELAFPLLTVAAIGSPSVTSLALSAALVLAFLAHEPVLVLLGHRGGRAREIIGSRAVRRASILGGGATLAGALGLASAAPDVRLALVPLAVAAVAVGALVWAKREKTGYGEALVAMTFAYAAVPVGLAGGVALPSTLLVAGVWASLFLLGTATVHAVLGRFKRKEERTAGASMAAALALLIAAAVLTRPSARWPLAVVPMAGTSFALLAARVEPKHLKRIGWSMVAAQLLTFATLVATL